MAVAMSVIDGSCALWWRTSVLLLLLLPFLVGELLLFLSLSLSPRPWWPPIDRVVPDAQQDLLPSFLLRVRGGFEPAGERNVLRHKYNVQHTRSKKAFRTPYGLPGPSYASFKLLAFSNP